MVYAITYDLKTPGQDYSVLYNKIQNLGTAIRPLQNLWLLDTSSSLDYVRDNLKSVIDQNDSIFVVQLYRGSYSAWMSRDAHSWIESRL